MKKWILIILGLVVLLVAVALFLFMRTMTPAKSGKVYENTYAVNQGMVNFFIYSDGKNMFAVDSGMDPVEATKGMKKLGLDPDRVTGVFLTHSDRDHVGGLKAFPNAKVYMLKEEEPVATGKEGRFFMGVKRKNSISVRFSTLTSGQTMRVGYATVKVVGLPGHTPGSAGYLVNDKIFFSGDAFRISNGRLTTSPAMMNNDNEKAVWTLKDFERSNIVPEIICTSHSGCLVKQ